METGGEAVTNESKRTRACRAFLEGLMSGASFNYTAAPIRLPRMPKLVVTKRAPDYFQVVGDELRIALAAVAKQHPKR